MVDPGRLLAELDFERLAGTPGERRARAVLTRTLRELGVPCRIETFPIHGFSTGSGVLEAGRKSWPVHPYGLESTRTVEGELAFLENADVLAYNRGSCRGKILLSYTTSQRLPQLLESSGLAAYIGISPPHRGTASLSHRQKTYTDRAMPPSATISYEDATALLAAGPRKVRLKLRQKTEKMTAGNIVLSLGKPVRDETLTYLVAHYDTVSRSHGSVDNAAGVICLLRLVEHFAAHPPERVLRVILFSGEELGLLGSLAYVKRHQAEMGERARLVVNIDLTGAHPAEDIFFFVGTRELQGWVGGAAREAGLMFKEALDVWPSDGMPFAVQEIPSVNIARVSGRALHYVHTADDTARQVSPRGMESTYQAARVVLERALGARIYPVRREIDDGLREKIEKYQWSLTYEKPALRWTERYRK